MLIDLGINQHSTLAPSPSASISNQQSEISNFSYIIGKVEF
jgi:hypothetical protein